MRTQTHARQKSERIQKKMISYELERDIARDQSYVLETPVMLVQNNQADGTP